MRRMTLSEQIVDRYGIDESILMPETFGDLIKHELLVLVGGVLLAIGGTYGVLAAARFFGRREATSTFGLPKGARIRDLDPGQISRVKDLLHSLKAKLAQVLSQLPETPRGETSLMSKMFLLQADKRTELASGLTMAMDALDDAAKTLQNPSSKLADAYNAFNTAMSAMAPLVGEGVMSEIRAKALAAVKKEVPAGGAA